MRKKVIRNWIIIFSLLFVACFLIMGFYYILFRTNDTFNFKNKRILVDKDSYKIEIDLPVYNSGKMNKEVDVLIDTVKSDFVNKANDDMNRMKMNYSYSIRGDIYSFHHKALYYKEDDYVKRDDFFKYYDSKNNVELSIDDLVKRNDEYLIKIKYVINQYLSSYKDIKINEEDINNLIFSEDKVYIVIPNGEKEINVPIEYENIKIFLNKEYFDVEGEYKEIVVKETVKEEKKEEPKEQEEKKEEQTKEEQTKEEQKKEEPKKEAKKETKPQVKKEQPKEELKSTNDGSQNKITPVVRDAAYFQGKKLICFTFDDGPAGKNTTKLLNALKERNYKASFFMVGNRVKNNASLVKRMKEEGHSIGQHSYSHANLKKLSASDPNKAKNEIYLANDAIKNVIGENPRYIRPPYGAYNSDVLSYADMVFVNWSIDPLDWKYRNANTVYNNIIKKAYDGAIVLVHDIHPTSVDGAIKAMDYLASKGYAIVSLDEMAKLRGINLQTHHMYNHFKK